MQRHLLKVILITCDVTKTKGHQKTYPDNFFKLFGTITVSKTLLRVFNVSINNNARSLKTFPRC